MKLKLSWLARFLCSSSLFIFAVIITPPMFNLMLTARDWPTILAFMLMILTMLSTSLLAGVCMYKADMWNRIIQKYQKRQPSSPPPPKATRTGFSSKEDLNQWWNNLGR